MSHLEIDTYVFIDEIRRRPALWNTNIDSYTNKIIKKKTWEEMVLVFGNSGDTVENKKSLGKYIIITFTTL